MASTEPTISAQHSEKEDRLDANHSETKSTKELTSGADGVSDVGPAPVGRSRDPSPASLSSASGLSSSKGGTQSPAPSASGNTPPLSMPYPKKFSHVNINKKFLEKTSSTSAPTHAITTSPVSKTVNPSQKPILQTTTPHPRLVTAKLTATPQPSSTAGWSRSSSTVPSAAPTPNPTSNPKPSTAAATSSTAAPLPPPAGKVIQPQPRSSQDPLFAKKDGSSKPVWGNAKGGAVAPLNRVQADFPTAAEVAQGRLPKASDKAVSNDANAQKQAAEADTFRGVHLDPNAHHWDEMEEDDDNFLGGVIEFGDGRQYNVQPSEARATSPPKDAARSPTRGGTHGPGSGTMDQPVSKEERFAEDFDRSWPRSRSGHQSVTLPRDQRSNGTPTSPASTSVHSPQEPSRQLFNERSNRLEPYSHQRHGAPGPPSHFNRRGSRPEYVTSPTELRRDAPPHAHSYGVQLLQKGPNDGIADGPPFSRAPGERSPISPADSRFRDRQSHRQDHPPRQTDGPPGPGRGHAPFGAVHPPRRPRDAPFDDRRRSSGNETLSPLGVDNRRQLPPHLSSPGPRNTPLSSTEGDGQPRSPVPPPSALPSAGPHAPTADGQADNSPVDSEQAPGPLVDVEEVRKAAMHNAAERARLRRQQEEEEREREKERARKKAAEIEERMKAMELEKARESEKVEAEKQKTDAQVLGLIEEAVSSVASPEKRTDGLPGDQRGALSPLTFGRSASSRGTQRIVPPRRTSFPASSAIPIAPSPASEADTWRRKGPLSPPRRPDSQELPAPSVLPPPVLAHTDLDVKEGEDVDIVDFADLGKLVGSESSSQPLAPVPSARPPRAVAADFFAEQPLVVPRPQLPSSKADEGPWRRQSTFANGHPSHVEKPPSTEGVVDNARAASESSRSNELSGPNSAVSPPPWHEDHHRRLSGHPQNGIHKSPQGSYYREAPMSTLNDVMARIKGAIDGMHHDADIPKELSKEAHKESPKDMPKDPAQDMPKEAPRDVLKEVPKLQKWLPPAKRPKTALADIAHPTEVFDVTATEPPKSPKKAWNLYTVKLASDSRPVQPDPTTQLVWPRNARSVRLDVESWNSPLDTRHRRASSVNDVIFGSPHYSHGQPKYSVSLPRGKIMRRPLPGAEPTPTSPIVNLPASPPRLRNTGPTETEGPNWRKALVSPSLAKESTPDVGLDTVSRSPPPETPSTKPTLLVPDMTGPSSASANAAAKKMPPGSDVAFYRATVEPQGQVQFIVTSELEANAKSARDAAETKPAPSEVLPSVHIGSKVDSATTTVPNGLSTPPQQTASLASQWSKSPKALGLKESPSRAPDPEHLKAVWSQTSDKTQNPPVNSLKGIVDDLTGVPFSLQDVKSDDGETPPPSSGSGPWSKSKMSAYDVTRAFQQVPSSSGSLGNSSKPRPVSIAPSMSNSSSTNGIVPRHPGFAFSPPPVNQPAFRPTATYPAYSPMMSHAHSATIMYSQPSPVPRPMVVNGQPPVYGQPVWMPAVPGPPPPPSSGVMRSPYPAQLVPYPSPGSTVPMYSSPMPGMQNPQMQPPPPPPQNGAHGRPMGMPLVSPVMQHAMPPMYAGSPVLMHTPPHIPPGQAYPAPGHSNRGPMPQHPSPSTPHMHHSPMRPQNGYNSVPSSYTTGASRPAW